MGTTFLGIPGGSDGKVFACNAGDLGSIPGSGRSPGEGNGNPLQYSCLENSMDEGAWWATVHKRELDSILRSLPVQKAVTTREAKSLRLLGFSI